MAQANTEGKYYQWCSSDHEICPCRGTATRKSPAGRDLELAWRDHDPVEAVAAASAKSTAKSSVKATVHIYGSAPAVVRTGKKRGRSNGMLIPTSFSL